jgi:inosine-uridine nucleoside N-ribohydrolase
LEEGSVRVPTDGLAQGQTIVNRRPYIRYPHPGWGVDVPRTQVCMAVDTPGCLALFEDTLMSDWLKR